jgi:hypothetical protein
LLKRTIEAKNENLADLAESPLYEATKGENIRTEAFKMRKRINSTTYEVSVYFSQKSKETLNDKIMRLIRYEAGRK